MKYLICLSNQFGGTDRLLKSYSQWLSKNGNFVDEIFLGEDLKKYDKIYDLTILPTSQMSSVAFYIKKGIKINRILIWCMGGGRAFQEAYYNPLHFKSSNFIKRIVKDILEKEINGAIGHFYDLGSCIFTDEIGMNSDLRKVKFEPQNLVYPIPIKEANRRKNYFVSNKKYINFCWIGRISLDFKTYALIKLFHELNRFLEINPLEFSINFTIVGEGEGMKLLKDSIKSIKNINFIYENNIENEKLNDFIIEKVDYLFAMGTSALEGAKVGCPTVLIPPVRTKEEMNKTYYRWIFESKGYCLGEITEEEIEPIQVKRTLVEIMNKLIEDTKRDESKLGLKSLNYSKEFYEEEVFSRLSLRDLPRELTEETLKRLRKNYFLKEFKSSIKKLIRRKSEKI